MRKKERESEREREREQKRKGRFCNFFKIFYWSEMQDMTFHQIGSEEAIS